VARDAREIQRDISPANNPSAKIKTAEIGFAATGVSSVQMIESFKTAERDC